MDGKDDTAAQVNLSRRIENHFASFEITPTLKKLFCAFTASTFLGLGVRSALRHVRGPQTAEYSQARLVLFAVSGVTYASRALTIATVITVSGYALFIVGISAILDVNTPRQFGDKMKAIFGKRFRLKKNKSVSTFREILRIYQYLQHFFLFKRLFIMVTAIVIFLFLSAFILLYCRYRQRALPKSRRTLLVFAHPDDETMFFAPTLHGLLQFETSVYFLCISTGNQSGLGKVRKEELARAIGAHGFSVDNLTILDYESFKDGFVVWCREELAKAVLRHIEMLDVDTVITFDEDGVSLHPNHASCFRALQYLYSNGLLPAGVQVFVLESVPIWRKYFLLVDAVVSAFHSTFLYVSPPSAYFCAWRAMFAHYSQLLWFRYLYMMFSRYILINTLKRIHLQPRYYIRKKTK